MTELKSAEALLREANGGLEMTAIGSAAPKLDIVGPGERRSSYQLRQPAAEEMLQAKRRFEALAGSDEAAFDAATWVTLLGTFMDRQDAARFMREQTFPTVNQVLRALSERAARELQRAG